MGWCRRGLPGRGNEEHKRKIMDKGVFAFVLGKSVDLLQSHVAFAFMLILLADLNIKT